MTEEEMLEIIRKTLKNKKVEKRSDEELAELRKGIENLEKATQEFEDVAQEFEDEAQKLIDTIDETEKRLNQPVSDINVKYEDS